MSMKENDAATVLSQMSQLGSISFDLSPNAVVGNDTMLEADTIGATCTLQSSSLRSDFFGSQFDSGFDGSKNDPYIGFDDAEHTYAVSKSLNNDTLSMKMVNTDQANNFTTPLNPLACLLCNKVFRTPQLLSTHLNFHNGKRVHVCQICMRSFTTKSDLSRHQKVHEKHIPNKFKCELCLSTFRDQATKTRHMKSHEDKQLHKCEQCFKQFSRTDSYKEHLRTHLDKKIFQCKTCKSEFNYKSSYNRHLKTHQATVSFSCNVCGKTFKRRDYLTQHKFQNHTNNEVDGLITSTKSCRKTKSSHKKNCSKKRKARKSGNTSKKDDLDLSGKPAQNSSNLLFSDDMSLESIHSQNVVPILMSMAENAANSFRILDSEKNNRHQLNSNNLPSIENSPIISELPLSSPSHSDFMKLLDESSTEEDCDSVISDEYQICSDIDDNVSHVSCIVSNPTNIST